MFKWTEKGLISTELLQQSADQREFCGTCSSSSSDPTLGEQWTGPGTTVKSKDGPTAVTSRFELTQRPTRELEDSISVTVRHPSALTTT